MCGIGRHPTTGFLAMGDEIYGGFCYRSHLHVCVCVMCACVCAPASVLSCFGAYVVLIDGVCIHTYSKVLCTRISVRMCACKVTG